MEKRWVWPSNLDEEVLTRLQEEINVSPEIAAILLNRGIKEYDQAKTFFRPQLDSLYNPFLMKDMDKAIDRLNDAISNQQRILIYGDYDVDGTTSVALVCGFLSRYHSEISHYIPDRYKEGYGISSQGIEWAAENGISLIIALDCGITGHAAVDLANKKDIDVIICDHHNPAETLPSALAVLDPKRKDCEYPFKELSGCGIGFKLLQAYCQSNDIEIRRLYKYLDLVAISIASDIVPIIDENRILAHYGLKILNHKPSRGIQALINISGLRKPINVSDIVFGIGPRINASGRLDHATEAVELLLSQTDESARELAQSLNSKNEARKDLDRNITAEALALIEEKNSSGDHYSHALFHESWHKGVLGIVASRCVEVHYRPTIILTEDGGVVTGSARSIPGFDIYSALHKCSHLLLKYGGHKYAAGLTMEPDRIKDFQDSFEKVVTNQISDDLLNPTLKIEVNITLDRITDKFFKIVEEMAPFGPSNMRPIFAMNNVQIYGTPRIINEKHLKFAITQEGSDQKIDVFAYNWAQHLKLIHDGPFALAFTIEMQEYMGQRYIQLIAKDFKINNHE